MSVPDLSRQNCPTFGKGESWTPKGFLEGPRWQEGCSGRLGMLRGISRSMVSQAGEAVERRWLALVHILLCADPAESAGIRRPFSKMRVWSDFSSQRGGLHQPR